MEQLPVGQRQSLSSGNHEATGRHVHNVTPVVRVFQRQSKRRTKSQSQETECPAPGPKRRANPDQLRLRHRNRRDPTLGAGSEASGILALGAPARPHLELTSPGALQTVEGRKPPPKDQASTRGLLWFFNNEGVSKTKLPIRHRFPLN